MLAGLSASLLVIELAGLLPLQSVVLLLCLREDKVSNNEGWSHDEEGTTDPPENIRKS